MNRFVHDLARRAAGLPAGGAVAPALTPADLPFPAPAVLQAAPASPSVLPTVSRLAAPTAASPAPAGPTATAAPIAPTGSAPPPASGPVPSGVAFAPAVVSAGLATAVPTAAWPTAAGPSATVAGPRTDSAPRTVEPAAPAPRTEGPRETGPLTRPSPVGVPTKERPAAEPVVTPVVLEPTSPRKPMELPRVVPREPLPANPVRIEGREPVEEPVAPAVRAVEGPRAIRPATNEAVAKQASGRAVEPPLIAPTEPRAPVAAPPAERLVGPGLTAPVPPAPAPVEVRIGTVEVRLSAPPAAPPAPPPTAADEGFEEYDRLRAYVYWEEA